MCRLQLLYLTSYDVRYEGGEEESCQVFSFKARDDGIEHERPLTVLLFSASLVWTQQHQEQINQSLATADPLRTS